MPRKLTLSPGQGLLILFNHYRDHEEKAFRIKLLYLSGAENSSTRQEIRDLLSDDLLHPFYIDASPSVINEDPSRRYFETHLSYETLIHNLGRIELTELQQQFNAQLALFGDREMRSELEHMFEGNATFDDSSLEAEYQEHLNDLQSRRVLDELSESDREKLIVLIKSTYLAIVGGQVGLSLPLDLYNEGMYLEKNRGKINIPEEDRVSSQHLGLMKNYMPLARSDIGYTDGPSSSPQPSGYSRFQPDSAWARDNFARMVHPFSNSISGTMLMQLRILARLKRDNNEVFTTSSEKLTLFLQLLISARLYKTGGHTLREWAAPLDLPKVRNEFSSIPGSHLIHLTELFLKKNQMAFDKALEDTIRYNQALLLRNAVQAEIKHAVVGLQSVEGKVVPRYYDQEQLLDRIEAAKQEYNAYIRTQSQNFFTAHYTENEIVREELYVIQNTVKEGHIETAASKLADLKEKLTQKSDEGHFLRCASELIASLEENFIRVLRRAESERPGK